MLGLFACTDFSKNDHLTPDGFEILSDNSQFKLIAFEDSEELPNEDYFIESLLMISDTMGDTIHYVPSYKYYVEYYKESPIYQLLSKLHKGDSIHLRIKEDVLQETFGFNPLLANSNRILELRLRAVQFLSNNEVGDTLLKNLALRSKLESKKIEAYLNNEIDKMSFQNVDGIYRKSLIKSTNERVKIGDKIVIEYVGSFLNGYVFDSKTGDNALEITFGMSDQIISGFDKIIPTMGEAESVKIILPSRHAFGSKGSIKGIVPPYTPIVYKLTIKKVIH